MAACTKARYQTCREYDGVGLAPQGRSILNCLSKRASRNARYAHNTHPESRGLEEVTRETDLASALPHPRRICTSYRERRTRDQPRRALIAAKDLLAANEQILVTTDNRRCDSRPVAGKYRTCEHGQKAKETQPHCQVAADSVRSTYDHLAGELGAQSLVAELAYRHRGGASGVLSPSK